MKRERKEAQGLWATRDESWKGARRPWRAHHIQLGVIRQVPILGGVGASGGIHSASLGALRSLWSSQERGDMGAQLVHIHILIL